MNLSDVKEVYYHSNCPDGTGGAIICSAAFKAAGIPHPKFQSVQYGTERLEKLEARPGQLFVDITPPRDRWDDWKGMDPIVLDHHPTAKHVVEGLGGVYGNTDYSGSLLAFENVMVPLKGNMTRMDMDFWYRFAHLCMIRDTWKTDHEDWFDACCQAHALQTFDRDAMIETPFTGLSDYGSIMGVGKIIYQRIIRGAKSTLKAALKEEICGSGTSIKVACFNLDKAGMSDTAHVILEEGYDVAIGYFFMAQSNVLNCVVSLRSNNMDVSEIARSLGGGGHKGAAGFRVLDAGTMSPQSIFDIVKGRLRR